MFFFFAGVYMMLSSFLSNVNVSSLMSSNQQCHPASGHATSSLTALKHQAGQRTGVS